MQTLNRWSKEQCLLCPAPPPEGKVRLMTKTEKNQRRGQVRQQRVRTQASRGGESRVFTIASIVRLTLIVSRSAELITPTPAHHNTVIRSQPACLRYQKMTLMKNGRRSLSWKRNCEPAV